MHRPVRVLVVDDDPRVRDAYRALLTSQQEFTLCAAARDGRGGVEAYAKHRPDLALMDLQMPGVDGIEATRQICRRWPDACVVALTTFGTNEYVVAALRAGAAGYLLKDAGGPALLVAMREALDGQMPLAAAIRRDLVASLVQSRREPGPAHPDDGQPALTGRELDVLTWLAQGLTNQQIGTRMYVSEGSVKQYLSQIGTKLGVKSRTGILIRSVQLRLVDPHALPPVQD